MYGFGVLGRGPPGVSRALHCEQRKKLKKKEKKRKTSRGKVLDLKILNLRGAWRDHCFPEPFSWFLHETGLESLKITSARCFLLKCQRKDSKKAKEYRQFRGVIGRWRTAAIDRTTFHACQRCRKTAVFAVFSRFRGVIWRGKAFRDQQCQFLTRNKSLSSENESNCSMTSECVRTNLILPRGAGLEHGRCTSRFSRFQFSTFWSNGLASSVFIFAPILLRFFLFSSSMQELQYFVTIFLISTWEKSYASSKPTG